MKRERKRQDQEEKVFIRKIPSSSFDLLLLYNILSSEYKWMGVLEQGGQGEGASRQVQRTAGVQERATRGWKRIRRKFFIQYLRRLISEQIEFYYPMVGTVMGAVEKQFFLLFHNSQVMYPLVQRWLWWWRWRHRWVERRQRRCSF